MANFIKPLYAYLIMLAIYFPISEIYLQILNYILIKRTKPRVIPKIDMLNGIDEMKRAIQIFEWVGCDNLANNYKKDFERFVR